MYHIKWKLSKDFRLHDSPEDIICKFKALQLELDFLRPNYATIDTETDGLHIKNCKPFLVSIAFANFETKKGVSYTIEVGCKYFHYLMLHIYEIFSKMNKLAFFNTKFDLHMLENIGEMYPYKNITDVQVYIRLASDAKSKEEGGAPSKLKVFATKYIDPFAKNFEHELKEEITRKKRENTRKLKETLKKFGEPPQQYKVKNEKSWTLATIENFFRDPVNEVYELPDGVREAVQTWIDTTPNADNYKLLNRENVIKYAHYDVIFTMEALYISIPVVKARQQEHTLQIEEESILPFYKMENVGFKFNLPYALETKEKLRNYIRERREDLIKFAGTKLKVNDRGKILNYLHNYGIETETTNKHVLHNLVNTVEDNEHVKEFLSLINEIRTLEKWYSTYILKWINSIGNDGRVYTEINQTGAVSGRVSSDFQQFPSKPILDYKGNVLFHPRRLVQVTGDGYDSIVYIDFAAEELRFQAVYTMLVSGGDLNFCRAFIPLKCHTADGTKYTTDMAYTYFDKEWFKDENNEKWHPTDLHAHTAMEAFPNEPTDTDYFKNTLRKKYGKPTNFACVYGASVNTLIKQFYFAPDMAKALHDGFYKSYPKILEYAKWVERTMNYNGYVENLFGRRYYNTSPHKARNYLVQGSCADYLKIKVKEIDDFLTKNNYKTRFQMNIHDECSFEIYKGEEHIIKDLQNIMQQLDGSPIPILADLEITYTTWDEKKDLIL